MGRLLLSCVLFLAACKVSGDNSPEACMQCADITTHAWCAASASCVGIHDSCEYGLLSTDSQCDQPQLFEPTVLAVDCRQPDATDPRCDPDHNAPPKAIGKGPMDNFYAFGGGFIDAANHRLVTAFSCDICSQKDSGVMAIDLTTGDRTLVSGQVNDTLLGIQKVGTGDRISSLDDVQPAPGGKWWALDSISGAAQIIEIDPATGNRTIVYPQEQFLQDGGICKVGTLGIALGFGASSNSFTSGLANIVVHPDGKVYIRGGRAYDKQLNELDLYAIAELDHGACRIVTAFSTKMPDLAVGNGPTFNEMYDWLGERNGALVAGVSEYYMHAIDIASGDRTMISSAATGGMLGDGGALGAAFVTSSPDGATLLTTGKFNTETFGGTVNIDVATGTRTTLAPAAGPQKNGDDGLPIAMPGLDGVYVIASLGMVTLYEPATGNSMFLSR